jgi:hypothetical protein
MGQSFIATFTPTNNLQRFFFKPELGLASSSFTLEEMKRFTRAISGE